MMTAPRVEVRSCVPDPPRLPREQDLRAGGSGGGVGGKRRDERLDEARLDLHVVVQENDRVSAFLERDADPRVHPAGEAPVLGQPHEPDRGVLGRDGIGAAVARTVVDHEHGERPVRDPGQRPQASKRALATVPREHDRRHARLAHARARR